MPLRDAAFLGQPDLVDESLRLGLAADSFEFHGTRPGLVRDARRYNGFVVGGWMVLRFSWEDVILRPELVRQTLATVVARRTDCDHGDRWASRGAS